ncbi:hypothetical protein CCP1ISM_50035 [Azospirillaceae bacterium]
MDILQGLKNAGFTPVPVEDDGGFEPVTGKYVCRIDSAGRKQGTSERTGKEYDFRTIKLQVAEIIEGDKATNRFFDKAYNPDDEGVKALLNDLFTAGITITAKTDDELDAELSTLVDKTINIRTWVWTPDKDKDKNPIPVEDRVPRQMIKVVKDFKGKKKADSIKSEIPF